MDVFYIPSHAEPGPNYHREDAPHFIQYVWENLNSITALQEYIVVTCDM